ncbi:class I SAM-dependent DNA methyltransferase [Methylobacterium sp. BTF04]|uniref:class I SAM-dependent DNA methyltransferase n=1 Tax=Methylobacterium sp. BTF04 TaxID=2708300 RepID=UPI0013D2A81A|nr:DNA methyltransferase [Methylobacterium sp. BTF04]NEU12804.1 class I SAM-dependent DNA methyltransferase [Methylobacterium sp. BTF04]
MVEAFIKRWQGREGGQERANYGLFLSELCDVLDVPRPDPAGATTEGNDYVFERGVREPNGDGTYTNRRIDLYKRGAFILEAKQSRQVGGSKEVPGAGAVKEPAPRGRRGAERAWDVLMLNARRQAEGYARSLPSDHPWPPIILVCDVGNVIEVFADFSGQGRNYSQFPDRQGFRVYLEDLRRPEIRERLRAVWLDPHSLDPARQSARVTREVAKRLAAVSRALEGRHDPEEVAMFLMRCLFTMFAEDVSLLPERSFRDLLARCEADPSKLQPLVGQLWEAMDGGGYAYGIEAQVRRFNGEFFKRRTVLPLGPEEIRNLKEAADANWKEVEPAIFGTLLEQALSDRERAKLGAHYTPRAYVERLVVATVIEPLRSDWATVLSTAERQKAEGRTKDAIATVQKFQNGICATRIFDPACGTGNFLYVALELVKRLEGEVLEALADLGGQEALSGLEGSTVDPHQFLGLELNPRAAAIAELVLWIGFLQWHFRTKGAAPSDPILKAFRNVRGAFDAVLDSHRELRKDEAGKPLSRLDPDGEREPVYVYRNPRRPDWPTAEFIVGNPPFIGGKDLRMRLGDAYTEALWAAHPKMPESADFVMFWWDRAAELLTRKGTALRRFGFVTTNSISQVFQRRVMERHLNAKRPISLVMAVADHPWTKATRDAAAVRIAMTVAEAGRQEGTLHEVVRETGLDTDQPVVDLDERYGTINSDLTVGADVTLALPLRSNEAICSPGVKLHGAGFIVSPEIARKLGLGRRPGLDRHIRQYRNGRDLTSRPRDVMVIDLFGLSIEEVRSRFPEVYQHVLVTVKPDREKQFARSPTKDAEAYLRMWWLFGKPRQELRPALENLARYVVTVETTKHRVFQFLDATILPDNMLVAVGTDNAFHLGVLSSRFHVVWTLAQGGTLEDRPRYSKSRCFDPFPFPDATPTQVDRIRQAAEALDAHRKERQSLFPTVSLTDAYNVLAKLRKGATPSTLDGVDQGILDKALVLILRELHDELDAAVAASYGWPLDMTGDQLLGRLVALNKGRAAAERRGEVQWLRPAFQIPRLGSPTQKLGVQIEAELSMAEEATGRPTFPTDDMAQTAAVMAALAVAPAAIGASDIAGGFRRAKRVVERIEAVLSSLARMGFIASPDGGRSYVLRRAA